MKAGRGLGQVLHFLRPTLFCLAGLVVAILLSEFIGQFAGSSALDRRLQDIIPPSPDLTPEQVVRIQVEALQSAEDAISVVQCMCFASPDNRIVTGPLERFGKMMRSPPFDSFSRAAAILVSDSQVTDDEARVFVTVVSRRSPPQAFVWVLRRQALDPVDNCWMTEGVIPVRMPGNVAENETLPSKTI